MTDACPPCHHNCNQGRTCPARQPKLLGEHMRFLALVGLMALTACSTYAVRMYDHYGAAERGEAPAERGDDGDKGDDGEGKGSGKGEKGSGKGHGGKDKGDEGDDD